LSSCDAFAAAASLEITAAGNNVSTAAARWEIMASASYEIASALWGQGMMTEASGQLIAGDTLSSVAAAHTLVHYCKKTIAAAS
jgi:hypothetical protein